MIAVPSILIVAPNGTIKEAVEFSTPKRFSVALNVTGIVALELDVLKANICTARIFFIKTQGLTLPKVFSKIISVPVA